MPIKVGTLLKNLGNKAKIDLSDAKYADLLSANLEIPDEVANAIENGLFDVDTAKHNSDLDKHFRAKALNGVDAKIKELLDEGDLSPEAVTEILSEKNSYAKIALMKAKLKESIEAKHSGSSDTKAIKAEVAKLNADILALKKAKDDEIAQIKAQSEQAVLDYAIDSHLSSLQYANSEIPAEVNVMTAKNLINKVLVDKKAKIVRGADGKLQLKNSEIPDLDYLENNKPISFSDLTASTLASNKLLKVTDPNPQRNPGNKFQQQEPNKGKVDTSGLAATLRAESQALREANAA